MSNYPKIYLEKSDYISITQNKSGELSNSYAPLHNLVKSGLSEFTTPNLNFDRYNPLEILITDEYDGSTNIILNDDKNPPRLINSRIAIQENNTFVTPEHNGNAVTNVYRNDVLNIQIGLFKLYNTIPSLTFKGLKYGDLKCGSYTFYFKLADADGNLSNIILHSGIILVPVGLLGSYKLRMGLEDENSGKAVEFELNNCDSGFDYVKVFYERTSSGSDLAEITTYFMIDLNYHIINGKCSFTITGEEKVVPITLDDVKSEYADIATAKTQDVALNILFLGNVSAFTHNYLKLLQLAWSIYPVSKTTKVNPCSFDYSENTAIGNYDVKNVYNYTGYWADEFYRFGIVFIYDNNQLSPVFNVMGYNEDNYKEDLDNPKDSENFSVKLQRINTDYEPESYIFSEDNLRLNSKGVFKIRSSLNNWNTTTTQTISIQFVTNLEEFQKKLKEFNIKGYFFVRQRRIPTIIALGMVIGVTGKKFGSLPVLQGRSQWVTKSFLSNGRLLNSIGLDVYTNNASPKGLLIPDAELLPLTFNHIFTSQEFSLNRVGKVIFRKEDDHFDVSSVSSRSGNSVISKITAVNKETQLVTDGENYFSSVAGNPSEPSKTVDIQNDWGETPAQTLTLSLSLVRGLFGYYAGISTDEFTFGDLVNIKKPEFARDYDNLIKLEFLNRFSDFSLYSPISPRYNADESFAEKDFYNGDCFISTFTHRMMNNFADPEMPTNTKIVDPKCWAKNYAVRTTAYIEKSTDSLPRNCLKLSEGFYVNTNNVTKSSDPDIPTYFNQIVDFFEIQSKIKDEKEELSDRVLDTDLLKEDGEAIKLKRSEPIKTGLGLIDSVVKLVNASTEEWIPRGCTNINRADVNAVSFGQWITFPICSSMNLALRDLDYEHTTEEASFNRKRGFYPLLEMDPAVHIPESDSINNAAKKSICTNLLPVYMTIPFIKQEYFNRIYWSKPNVALDFINSYRMIFNQQFKEYSKEYGAITKVVSEGNYLVVVFDHGIGILEVNRNPQSEQELSPYLASKSVLPSDILEITPDYGSMWKDSVIKTPSGIIYGVDTVAKKIWRLVGSKLDFISDLKVGKFLNEFITLSEFDQNEYLGHLNVKTHYNEFKHDVIFTFKKDIPHYSISSTVLESLCRARINEFNTLTGNNIEYNSNSVIVKLNNQIFTFTITNGGKEILTDTYIVRSGRIYYNNLDTGLKADITWKEGTVWSLCFNERMDQFITFYDWYPYMSENINNIFFSFDQELLDSVYENSCSIRKEVNLTIISNGLTLEPDYFTQSKSLIDSAFNDKVSVGYVYLDNSAKLILDIPGNGYVCFYLKGATIKSLEGQSLECEDDYKFYFYQEKNWNPLKPFIPEDFELTIQKPGEVFIADLKFVPKDSSQDFNLTAEKTFTYYNLRKNSDNIYYLWKHGQGGLYDNQGEILPTNWYGKQHEFNFEFVVNDDPMRLKIFNNLKILSNKAEPNKFEYEVVGEGYEWFDYKPIVEWINKLSEEDPRDSHGNKALINQEDPDYWWKFVLGKTSSQIQETFLDFPTFKTLKYWADASDSRIIQKLPYLKMKHTDKKGSPERPSYSDDFWTGLNSTQNKKDDYAFNCNEVCLMQDDQLNEQRVRSESLGNDVKKFGRVRGNMEYLEDLWDVEIRPLQFKWVSLKDDKLSFETVETRHRDKYLKVKIRYSGKDLAIIQAIATMYDISYA